MDRRLTVIPRRPGNFSDVLTLSARRFGDREFVAHQGTRHTYAAFEERVNRLADGLEQMGVTAGDAIASLSPNHDALLALYFAIGRLGAVNVPINMMATRDDVTALVERTRATVLVYAAAFVDRLERSLSVQLVPLTEDGSGRPTLADVEAAGSPTPRVSSEGGDSPATIIFTSGSTARPKGCVKSHASLIWSAVNCQLETPRTSDTVELYVVPLSGVTFSNFLIPTAMAGGRILLDVFEPGQVLELIERERATHGFLPGSMLEAMLRQEEQAASDLSSLQLVETAYHLSERLREAIAQRFGPIVRFCYGATEGTNWAAPAEVFMSRPDCVGFPKGFDDFRVVDDAGRELEPGQVGEVMVGGGTVMHGYFDDPEGTAAVMRDGWWLTGDLGELADDGMLTFRGRKKDVIKTGGLSVSAAEVELAIARHPDVLEVAVIGVPDERWGEAVVAFVAPRSGVSDGALVERLRVHCAEQLAAYKRPKTYVAIAEIPKNPTGKIAKGELRARHRW